MTRFTGLCLGIALAFVMALGVNSGAMNYQSDGMGMGYFMLTAGGAGGAGGGMGGSAGMGPGVSSGSGGAFGTGAGMGGNIGAGGTGAGSDGAFGTGAGMSRNTGRSRADMGADTGNLGPRDMTRGDRGDFGNFGSTVPNDNFSGQRRFAQPGPNFGPDNTMNPGMSNNFGNNLNR